MDGILPEGLALIVGAPKIGKSWLVLGIGWAIAAGGVALGTIRVKQRPVLYLALEDNPRRLKRRLQTLFGDEQPPTGLDVWMDYDFDHVANWAHDHRGGVVFVDVLARIRPPGGSSQQLYDRDYQALIPLKTVADTEGVHVGVTHHDRKAGAEDWMHTISGTQGLTGAADTLVVLRRSRGKADAKLLVTGRDVEDTEVALSFTAGAWTALDGPASEWDMSPERRAIADAVRTAGALRPKAIADATSIDHDVVRQLVLKMVDAGQLDTDGSGLYIPVHSVHSVHSSQHSSEQSEQSERHSDPKELL